MAQSDNIQIKVEHTTDTYLYEVYSVYYGSVYDFDLKKVIYETPECDTHDEAYKNAKDWAEKNVRFV